jgi:hypothetical protein
MHKDLMKNKDIWKEPYGWENELQKKYKHIFQV